MKSLISTIGISLCFSPIFAMDNEFCEIAKLKAELAEQKLALEQKSKALDDREKRLVKREEALAKKEKLNETTEKFSLWGMEPLRFEIEPIDPDEWVEWEMKKFGSTLNVLSQNAQAMIRRQARSIASWRTDPNLEVFKIGVRAKACFKYYFSEEIKALVHTVRCQLSNEEPAWIDAEFMEALEQDIIENLASIMLTPQYNVCPKTNHVSQIEDRELEAGKSYNEKRHNFVKEIRLRILGNATQFKDWNNKQPVPRKGKELLLEILRVVQRM